MYLDEFNTILQYTGEEALRTGYLIIKPDHLMLGIIRHRKNIACKVLESLGVDIEAFKNLLDKSIFLKEPIPYSESPNLIASKDTVVSLNSAKYECSKDKCKQTQSEHLLLALVLNTMCFTWLYLKDKRIGYAEIKKAVEKLKAPQADDKQERRNLLIAALNGQFSKSDGSIS